MMGSGVRIPLAAPVPFGPFRIDHDWRACSAGDALMLRASVLHQPQLLFEHPQHAAQVVAALQHQPARGDDAVGTLLFREPGILLNAVNRTFARASEDREYGPVPPHIDGVVTPFPGGDLAAVNGEDVVELLARERNSRYRAGTDVENLLCARKRTARLARAQSYRIGIAQPRLLLFCPMSLDLPGISSAPRPTYVAAATNRNKYHKAATLPPTRCL